MVNVINGNFGSNFRFQDGFQEQVKEILQRNAQYLLDIRLSTPIEDTRQATDMVMRVESGVDVAVRIRRPNCEYRELTIRSRASNGGKTELDKLREGWGDWYVYAWSNRQGLLNEWILVNIHTLRKSGALNTRRFEIPNKPDDGTRFVAIKQDELFRAGALVSASLPSGKYPSYMHHIVHQTYGQVWQQSSFSILKPQDKAG